MATLENPSTYVPFDDMYPGSSFPIYDLERGQPSELVRAVRHLVPAGWEAVWESNTDTLEIRPKNAEVLGPQGFEDSDYEAWDRSGNHEKIKRFLNAWLQSNTKLASGGSKMTPKMSSQNADRVLSRLDRIAATVQERYASWGMDFEDAKEIVNALDKTADDIEVSTFGRQSLARRQAEIMGGRKTARVIQRDADEKYMDTFKNPMMPHQIESDEPYMKIYTDDQSSAVGSGQSTSGRKLVPTY